MRIIALIFAGLVQLCLGRDCPTKSSDLGLNVAHGGKQEVSFVNKGSMDLDAYWVNVHSGEEVSVGMIEMSQTLDIGSYVGHAFRIYSLNGHVLMKELVVEQGITKIMIYDCAGAFESKPNRDEEFAS